MLLVQHCLSMHRKLTCFLAFIIMLALSARVVVNLKHGLNDRKVKTEAAETNNAGDDKTEKDHYSESSAWLYQTTSKNWEVIIHYQIGLCCNDVIFILPKHFCAVPTPPPWA